MHTATQAAPAQASRRGTRDASVAMWPAIAAWGAGLVQLALGAGAVTGSSGQPAGLPLIALGLLALAWGAWALARGRVIAPRAGVAGVLAGLVSGAVALSIDPARTSVVAMAAASALLIAVAIGCGRALRAKDRATDASKPGLAGIFIGAVLVAAIVTPALGATEAGRLAPDHSVHGGVIEDPHHH
ncbi:hypothetical protein G5T42_09220 [Microbacterium sp. 4R-513]|uniref:hypothetical protein n=1 Tax=Microbacterium sp. 4R-513 TaxID=2567934 RepID=UPI0013E15EF6|nr:hypothetical protein [Microbacterium sp. 4R-513]QIG39645.1 hypothetical protein G5T42_09220 [Microbacterium sp. 4R-513]